MIRTTISKNLLKRLIEDMFKVWTKDSERSQMFETITEDFEIKHNSHQLNYFIVDMIRFYVSQIHSRHMRLATDIFEVLAEKGKLSIELVVSCCDKMYPALFHNISMAGHLLRFIANDKGYFELKDFRVFCFNKRVMTPASIESLLIRVPGYRALSSRLELV